MSGPHPEAAMPEKASAAIRQVPTQPNSEAQCMTAQLVGSEARGSKPLHPWVAKQVTKETKMVEQPEGMLSFI